MFEPVERKSLADAIAACKGEFAFVDIGANVGLFSLFVAAQAGARARILAIEPQPGIVDRLLFNLGANRDVRIETLAIAVADEEGEAELAINASDHGGTRLGVVLERFAAFGPAAPTVRVRCRPLLAVLAERYGKIDALKIDIEGAEDLALSPFLRDAPDALLPRLIVIEDSRASWRVDLFDELAGRGYCVLARSRQNVVLRRSPEPAGALARDDAPGTGM
jgi:FkbM family methyltransferase